jgi:hypothetical protein
LSQPPTIWPNGLESDRRTSGVQYKGEATGYFCPVNADLLDKKTLILQVFKDLG